jgi:hypothetical protein
VDGGVDGDGGGGESGGSPDGAVAPRAVDAHDGISSVRPPVGADGGALGHSTPVRPIGRSASTVDDGWAHDGADGGATQGRDGGGGSALARSEGSGVA